MIEDDVASPTPQPTLKVDDLGAMTHGSDGPGPFRTLVEAEWQALLDKDDRTSPADYPDMCLITRNELAGVMAEAWFTRADADASRIAALEARNRFLEAPGPYIFDRTMWRRVSEDSVVGVSMEQAADLLNAKDARIAALEAEIERREADRVEQVFARIAANLLAQSATERAEAAEDERHEALKTAFVAGCCAALTWTHSGMPQDDLDEAGYDYATSVRAALTPAETLKELGVEHIADGQYRISAEKLRALTPTPDTRTDAEFIRDMNVVLGHCEPLTPAPTGSGEQ